MLVDFGSIIVCILNNNIATFATFPPKRIYKLYTWIHVINNERYICICLNFKDLHKVTLPISSYIHDNCNTIIWTNMLYCHSYHPIEIPLIQMITLSKQTLLSPTFYARNTSCSCGNSSVSVQFSQSTLTAKYNLQLSSKSLLSTSDVHSIWSLLRTFIAYAKLSAFFSQLSLVLFIIQL